MNAVCVTNDMSNVRSCVVPGEHKPTCNGVRSGGECEGCLPRPAEKGFLCWSCWERVEHELNRWPEFAELISSIDRAVTPERIEDSGKPGSRIPIPMTRIDVDECESYLRSFYKASSDADVWVSHPAGAEDAVMFARYARRAHTIHQVEELPHRVRTNCPACGNRSLVWYPVPEFGGDVSIECSVTSCRHVIEQTMYERIALLEEYSNAEREKKKESKAKESGYELQRQA